MTEPYSINITKYYSQSNPYYDYIGYKVTCDYNKEDYNATHNKEIAENLAKETAQWLKESNNFKYLEKTENGYVVYYTFSLGD